jgi:sterol desaturase/sphingolipid hydroxylase (fatty acid hydroxylase superfamily)
LAVSQLLPALVVLGVCFAVFGVLGRLAPCNPGRPVFVSKSIGLDLGYCALGVLYAAVGPAAAALLDAVPGARSMTLGGWIAGAPLWAQAIGLIVATDFAQYWIHRAFHSAPLWPWHAVHHSAPDVNWTTTFRTHPVNYLVANAALAVLARLVGVSESAILIAAPVFFFSGAWTHANLDWTFGPLRYVIASPVFHRWHHSADAASRETNYAPMFPVWDLMFGTFHMPRQARPQRYGADGVPGDLIGQLIHPLRPGARLGTAPQARPDAARDPA